MTSFWRYLIRIKYIKLASKIDSIFTGPQDILKCVWVCVCVCLRTSYFKVFYMYSGRSSRNRAGTFSYKNSRKRSLSRHVGRFVWIGSEILFDGANCSRRSRREYCEAFYQKFNTNANFLRYSLPSFRQRYSRIMRVGGVLFYERRALIAVAALAINRPEHIARSAAPIFRSRRV